MTVGREELCSSLFLGERRGEMGCCFPYKANLKILGTPTGSLSPGCLTFPAVFLYNMTDSIIAILLYIPGKWRRAKDVVESNMR